MKQEFKDIAMGIFTSIRNASLYGVEHPLVKSTLQKPHQMLTDLLGEKKEVTFSAAGGELLIDNEPLSEEVPTLRELSAHLKRVEIETLTLSSGLTLEEFQKLVKSLLVKSEELKTRGGIKNYLSKLGLVHVKVNPFRYERVAEDEVVGGKGKGKGRGEGEGEETGTTLEKKEKKPKVPGKPRGAGAIGALRQENDALKARLAVLERRSEEPVNAEKEGLVRSNQRLDREKRQIENVVRSIAEGLIVTDADGKILMLNPAAERLLGENAKDRVGKHLSEGLKEGHLLAMVRKPVEKGIEEGAEEIELASPDDSTRKVLRASSAVIENEDGNTVGMVSVLTDITKQKELEQLKSDFVANVSHELRTPLISIQKALDLVLKKTAGEINPDQENFLSLATRNLDRLSRLINDLLDISKIESGKLEMRWATVDLKSVIREVLAGFKAWAETKGIKLEECLPAEDLKVTCDQDRIVQILTNLIGNALKFTPREGRISVGAVSVPERLIEIFVEDTGIGIPEKDRERIFNKFEQVALKDLQNRGGTGLGLTIAREIVRGHHGKIWVESREGQGSKFIFQLPAEKQ